MCLLHCVKVGEQCRYACSVTFYMCVISYNNWFPIGVVVLNAASPLISFPMSRLKNCYFLVLLFTLPNSWSCSSICVVSILIPLCSNLSYLPPSFPLFWSRFPLSSDTLTPPRASPPASLPFLLFPQHGLALAVSSLRCLFRRSPHASSFLTNLFSAETSLPQWTFCLN